MRVGISCFLTDKSVNIADLAKAAESRGFDEIWAPEHTHIPTGRETDWPMQDASELPEMYKRSLDPFVALTAAAMVTERIRIGTSICLVSQHDPIILAKTVATLDLLSGGRLTLGVGFGWNVDEMAHHGVDPDRRRTIGREKTLAMKELWTNDEATFRGDYVSFSPSWQWPKPTQKPHPPIWVGGGKSTMKHAVEWGDGWMPIEGVMPVARMTRSIRQMLVDAGRDPENFTVYLAGAPDDPAAIEEYREAGLDGISLGIPWDADADTALRILDEHVEFRDRYLS
jgi:probable F420-dependent oxidoreductase